MIHIITSIIVSIVICGIHLKIHEYRTNKLQKEFLTELRKVTIKIITDYLKGNEM